MMIGRIINKKNMAKKRMFSKEIIESDMFIDLPLSTQALYFHLGMQADDDGFVSPNRIVRMLGANRDDLKLLIAKGFAIQYESGIMVITHWTINNYIQSDRYKPTLYQKELNLFKKSDLYPKCIQNGHVDKIRLDKNRLVKGSKNSKTVDKSKDGTRMILHDGSQAVLRFGTWVDAKDPNVKISPQHYPEITKS